jgi:hypothetical protein
MAIAKISTDIFDPLLDVSMSGKKKASLRLTKTIDNAKYTNFQHNGR